MVSDQTTTTSEQEADRPRSGFFRRFFGPGMLWALLGIGGSHLVLAPTIGATFGYFGIWIALIVYLAKYGGWELGIRYAHATGKNPVEGYRQLPGPDDWGLWLTLAIYAVGWPTILGAVGSATASFAENIGLLSDLPETVPFFILLALALVLIAALSSRYHLVEITLLAFIVPLVGILVLGVFVSPPSPDLFLETLAGTDRLWTPAFLSLFAAFAGYAPTGLSTTATIGSWTTAKQRELTGDGDENRTDVSPEQRMKEFQSGRLDFNIGYLFSFLLILCMISLSATVLYPEPPSDRNLAVAIGQLLVPSFGPWTKTVMAIGGFAALYSTVLTVLDGSARVCTDVLELLFPNRINPSWTRYVVLLYMGLVSAVPVLVVGSVPVTLVVFSAAVMAVLQVFFFFANYYVVRTQLPESLSPGPFVRACYLLSMALVVLFGCMGAAGRMGLFGG